MDSRWVDVGTVVSIHGLAGELVVRTAADDPEAPTRYRTMHWYTRDGSEKEMTVESSRIHKGMALIKFRGVDDRDEAQEFVGGRFRVRREELVPLEEGRFYVVDLIGLSVETTDGRKIGPVRDVLQTGANDVYVIDYEGREVLIPAVDAIVKSVDPSSGKIVIEAMDGLLD